METIFPGELLFFPENREARGIGSCLGGSTRQRQKMVSKRHPLEQVDVSRNNLVPATAFSANHHPDLLRLHEAMTGDPMKAEVSSARSSRIHPCRQAREMLVVLMGDLGGAMFPTLCSHEACGRKLCRGTEVILSTKVS